MSTTKSPDSKQSREAPGDDDAGLINSWSKNVRNGMKTLFGLQSDNSGPSTEDDDVSMSDSQERKSPFPGGLVRAFDNIESKDRQQQHVRTPDFSFGLPQFIPSPGSKKKNTPKEVESPPRTRFTFSFNTNLTTTNDDKKKHSPSTKSPKRFLSNLTQSDDDEDEIVVQQSRVPREERSSPTTDKTTTPNLESIKPARSNTRVEAENAMLKTQIEQLIKERSQLQELQRVLETETAEKDKQLDAVRQDSKAAVEELQRKLIATQDEAKQKIRELEAECRRYKDLEAECKSKTEYIKTITEQNQRQAKEIIAKEKEKFEAQVNDLQSKQGKLISRIKKYEETLKNIHQFTLEQPAYDLHMVFKKIMAMIKGAVPEEIINKDEKTNKRRRED